MRKPRRAAALFAAIFMLIFLSACIKTEPPEKGEPIKRPGESFLKYGDTNETFIELNKVNSSIWVHTSYYEQNGELVPINGLLAVTDNGLVLIDTPWTEQQLNSLVKLIKEAFNGSLKGAVLTRTYPVGIKALTYLKNHEIPVYCLKPVADAVQKMGFILSDAPVNEESAILDIDNFTLELFYPGEGFTRDNTAVWIEKSKLLYAGGLFVEHGAGTLKEQNVSDKAKWVECIKAIQERYPEMESIVPEQGQWGSASLIIDYTLDLLKEQD